MNNFYVYRHLRKDTGNPFYVGKGNGKRPFSRSGRNRYWHRIVKLAGYEAEIMIGGLTEEEAYKKEMELIHLYKKHGYSEANLSKGGRGSSSGVAGFWKGKKIPKAVRDKISLKLLGNKAWNTGKALSKQHKMSLSLSHKGLPSPRRKRIIGGDGVVYNSITEAAIKNKIKRTTLNAMLSGQTRNFSGFKYLEE